MQGYLNDSPFQPLPQWKQKFGMYESPFQTLQKGEESFDKPFTIPKFNVGSSPFVNNNERMEISDNKENVRNFFSDIKNSFENDNTSEKNDGFKVPVFPPSKKRGTKLRKMKNGENVNNGNDNDNKGENLKEGRSLSARKFRSNSKDVFNFRIYDKENFNPNDLENLNTNDLENFNSNDMDMEVCEEENNLEKSKMVKFNTDGNLVDYFENIRNENVENVEEKRKKNSGFMTRQKCRLEKKEDEEFINELQQMKLMISPTKDDYATKLPTLPDTSSDLNCISSETACDLLFGKYSSFFDLVIFLDCRFDYEYDGGHIKGAERKTVTELEDIFIKNTNYHSFKERICLIFYCEYSSHRGPKSYKSIRSLDRKLNSHCYPKIFYPEMYLLEGGYKNFFSYSRDTGLCEPNGYVEMRDPNFYKEMKSEMNKIKKKTFKRRFISRSCSDIQMTLE